MIMRVALELADRATSKKSKQESPSPFDAPCEQLDTHNSLEIRDCLYEKPTVGHIGYDLIV